jgi:predicted ATPase
VKRRNAAYNDAVYASGESACQHGIMNSETSGMSAMRLGSQPCHTGAEPYPARLIAVTGGPGAGKSAVLELAARTFCSHVAILPEAATILFGGGFPRLESVSARRAAQRAIFRVQRELEQLAIQDGRFGTILCDRGTVDGIAYWPGPPGEFWVELGATREKELERYHAVLHLETPSGPQGYNHQNVVRVETPTEAHVIDLRIAQGWSGHPVCEVVPSMTNFAEKALCALGKLTAHLPACCAQHRFDGIKGPPRLLPPR